MNLIVEGPCTGRSEDCAAILRLLPEWFGIEQATQQYIQDSAVLPTFLASQDGLVLGFLTLRLHTPYAAEIHVMGVRPEAHGKGVGRALLQAAEQHLRSLGVEYLQVKTLSQRHPDTNYVRTRAFYLAMGFRPLEEFPLLWGEANPCLQLVKRL
ncbi:MAG: GNAT family N-acetyltransferase [Anaerolineales bacterium]|nr:GNAT family N-acetyltransferase [Anaerolineales bacterium]